MDGFRGIKWGANKADVSSLRLSIEKGSMSLYRRPEEKLQIGAASLDSILYLFYKQQLAGVTIAFTGFTNYVNLRKALAETYGEGHQENRYIDHWRWGNFGDDAATMSLDYNDISREGRLHIYSNEMTRIRNADATAEAKKARNDF